jgi:AcrR family transcriptional regulator
MVPRTINKHERRAQLVAAATDAFARQGVAATSVADIVRAAGVAQGTFYLYFTSKDDVILAVVEGVAETMLTSLQGRLDTAEMPAKDRLRAFGRLLADLARDGELSDVTDFIHRAENRTLHDRFAEHLLPRLLPLMEQLVADGVTDGSFRVADPRAAAWFVLGGLQSVELAGTPHAALPEAIDAAIDLALAALGASDDH